MAKVKDIFPIWEAAKEPLRLLVLAILPFAISYFANLPYEWAAAATVLLRFVDSIMHEVGKVKKDESLTLGLTRF